ncbi:hypothetical protein Aam_034_132 [Acidocella aminolytica 101 = DSM 11237]|uniref:Uncharacterized protein n=1 Tax=Acidocella aminolytica 101 = DSM 11237 TaxID=1120923 RepID=A0A0D6PFJ5_9PROT|nr:hypothetical protein Aam_034_132 [Acidocella aminolytica 101 = DSM 11237]GBQ35567.1 hypothetical protein AA11237_1006 [Acidocella aminolytica 101 = DSM 11237]
MAAELFTLAVATAVSLLVTARLLIVESDLILERLSVSEETAPLMLPQAEMIALSDVIWVCRLVMGASSCFVTVAISELIAEELSEETEDMAHLLIDESR